jgi:hypothetical protein
MRLLLLLVLICFTPSAVAAHGDYTMLTPVDEASKDASFLAFRQKLQAAVKARDVNFLVARLHPQISFGFGLNSSGIANFKKRWNLAKPRESLLWEELGEVLALGGKFEKFDGGKEFCAPYVFASWPQDLDAAEYSVILGPAVPLRSAPKADAPQIATLNHVFVKADYLNSVRDPSRVDRWSWVKVSSPEKHVGYVAGRFVRSPLQFRAYFAKHQGMWKMRVFVVGD